jgi:integrase/recombinase XerD
MDHLCSSGSIADCRFQDAPFADERNRYLSHCAAHGARLAVLKVKRNELRWIARRLGPDADRGVGMTELMPIALERQNLHRATTGARRVIDIGRPWLRFLGWWREPAVPFLDRGQLDRYVTWMRDERGFTPSTVEQWGRTTRRFLRWCAEAGRQLGDLTAGDIDNYVATQGKGRWTRVSTANMVSGFLAFRRQRGVVLEPIGRVDFPASALSAGVFAICPGLVCSPANAGRRRHGQATGYPRSRHPSAARPLWHAER